MKWTIFGRKSETFALACFPGSHCSDWPQKPYWSHFRFLCELNVYEPNQGEKSKKERDNGETNKFSCRVHHQRDLMKHFFLEKINLPKKKVQIGRF